MESSDNNCPTVDQFNLEDVESTPESSIGDSHSIISMDLSKTESPKQLKPVLGKIKAKRRLMAFANQFSQIPKVQTVKNKVDRVKKEEKILAIEEIVREESRSKLIAQGTKEGNSKNDDRSRRNKYSPLKDRLSEERHTRRSLHKKKSDREKSRDQRSRSRSRQRSSHKSSREADEHHNKNKHKKDKKTRHEEKDNEFRAKTKNNEENGKKEHSNDKIHKVNLIDEIVKNKFLLNRESNETIEIISKETQQKKPEHKQEIEENRDKLNESIQIQLYDDINVCSDNDFREIETEESKTLEKKIIELSTIEKSEDDLKGCDLKKKDISKTEKIRITDEKFSDENTGIVKLKAETKIERAKRDDDKRIEKLKTNDAKSETCKNDYDVKERHLSLKDSKKKDRVDSKEKWEEPRPKNHKSKAVRERELLKCCCWNDFKKAGFFIEDVSYYRRSESEEKSCSDDECYGNYDQILMLCKECKERKPFIADSVNAGSVEYPRETIKTTKSCKVPLIFCENPKESLLLTRELVLSLLPPDRVEKMQDICDAKQIRIITSEREEAHQQRLWYKTLDPSKSISQKVNLEVPLYPKSKWDSENELSDDQMLTNKIQSASSAHASVSKRDGSVSSIRSQSASDSEPEKKYGNKKSNTLETISKNSLDDQKTDKLKHRKYKEVPESKEPKIKAKSHKIEEHTSKPENPVKSRKRKHEEKFFTETENANSKINKKAEKKSLNKLGKSKHQKLKYSSLDLNDEVKVKHHKKSESNSNLIEDKKEIIIKSKNKSIESEPLLEFQNSSKEKFSKESELIDNFEHSKKVKSKKPKENPVSQIKKESLIETDSKEGKVTALDLAIHKKSKYDKDESKMALDVEEFGAKQRKKKIKEKSSLQIPSSKIPREHLTSASITGKDDISQFYGNEQKNENNIKKLITYLPPPPSSPPPPPPPPPKEQPMIAKFEECNDDKLVSEYEQFMKIVSSSEIIEPSDASEQQSKNDDFPSPTKFDELSLELNNLADIDNCSEIPMPSDRENEAVSSNSLDESILQENVNGLKESFKQTSDEFISEDQDPDHLGSDNHDYSSDESCSVPSDWENVKIKVEKVSDAEKDKEHRRKKIKTKKRRKRRDSYSSDSSSSTYYESDNKKKKRKKRKKKKKHAKKIDNSSSSSEISDSSSSETSSSEDAKSKRKNKKLNKKRKKKLKKSSKKLKKKHYRKYSTETSSSDTEAKSSGSKKKKAKKPKNKKKKKSASKDNSEIEEKDVDNTSAKTKSSKHNQLKESSVKNSLKTDETSVKEECKKIKILGKQESSFSNTSNQENEVISTVTNLPAKKKKIGDELPPLAWDKVNIIPKPVPEPEILKIAPQNHLQLTLPTEITAANKNDSCVQKKEEKIISTVSKLQKYQVQESNEAIVKLEKSLASTQSKIITSKDCNQLECGDDWGKESKLLLKDSKLLVKETASIEQYNKLEKLGQWINTDFDFPSITQLDKVGKSEIFANDWEIDSLEAINNASQLLNERMSPKSVIVPAPLFPERQCVSVSPPKNEHQIITATTLPKKEKMSHIGNKKIEKVKYDEKTDTYIPVETEAVKDVKKKREKQSILRIWEDEEENEVREQLSQLIVKKEQNKRQPDPESKRKDIPSTDENSSLDPKNILDCDAIGDMCRPSKKSRWDVKTLSPDHPNVDAPPVNWEEEANIWPNSSNHELPKGMKEIPIEDCGIDSPERLRLAMKEIAMLEKALGSEAVLLSPAEFALKDYGNLQEKTLIDSNIEKNFSESLKNGASHSAILSDGINKERLIIPPLQVKACEIDDSSEFSIPALSEIDPKIESPSKPSRSKSDLKNKYRGMFLDLDDLKIDQSLLNKNSTKNKISEQIDSKEFSPKLDNLLKLPIPVSLDLAKDDKLNKPLTNYENLQKKSIKSENLLKADDSDIISSKESKSRTNNRRKSPTHNSERKESRSRKESKSNDKDLKKLENYSKTHKSRSESSEKTRCKSPPFREKDRSLNRNLSRSRSRSPRKKDERYKYSDSKRDKRSPPKQSYSYKEDSKKYSSHKSDRDWSKRKYDDCFSPENSTRPYDTLDLLGVGAEKDFELERLLLSECSAPNDKLTPYIAEFVYENKIRLRDATLDKEHSSRSRHRDSGKWYDKRDRRDSRSPEARREKLRKLSPRLTRRSPIRSKYTSRSRSRSRSWTRSRSRSRSRSRTRSRSRSESRSRYRNIDCKSPVSRSFSPSNYSSMKTDDCKYRQEEDIRQVIKNDNTLLRAEKPRRLDTIIQLTGTGELHNESIITVSRVASNKTLNDENSYNYNSGEPISSDAQHSYRYYQNTNLTYPQIKPGTSSSPKRLSLDERLELELGIKKQMTPEPTSSTSSYGSPALSNVPGYSNIQQAQQKHAYRPSQKVVQIGNVLQVVPAELPIRNEGPVPSSPAISSTNQILRVGNVLQVVPTTQAGWVGPQQLASDTRQGVFGSNVTPASPAITASPITSIQPTPVKKVSGANVIPAQAPVVKQPLPEPVPLPVYNYEAIMEVRRQEKEERKRLREIKRKEKERRRYERTKKRAEKVLGKGSSKNTMLLEKRNLLLDKVNREALLNADNDGEMEEFNFCANALEDSENANELSAVAVDNDEEVNENEEAEIDEVRGEVSEEPNEDELRQNRIVKEIEANLSTSFPLKGILISPGFGSLSNGLSELEELQIEMSKGEAAKVEISNVTEKEDEASLASLKYFEKTKIKKSVQFADGVKPGEGTDPSGGEGDMSPSSPPPPLKSLPPELAFEISKKLQLKKTKKKRLNKPQPGTKVKVKVKLKKPKVSSIAAVAVDESDDADNQSPPPPPPGSPPPLHLWPDYLSSYTASMAKAVPTQNNQPISPDLNLSSPQGPAPPTPLPLLVPPPPLNYSIQPIQPCSKA